MAVYKPNANWFVEQLESINGQDYKGKLDLLVWNDSPLEFQCEGYLAKYITKFSYQILDNGKNNGVTVAFSKLTEKAIGSYIAYSDQDDVWMSDKISTMIKYMITHVECTCCHSDAILMDDNGQIIKDYLYPSSLNKINNKIYQEKIFVASNWALGCGMVVKAEIAKSSLPFPIMIFHDQWIELYVLFHGKFVFIKDKLIKHRIHRQNNSETLHGINSKKLYYKMKLGKDYDFLQYLTTQIRCKDVYKEELLWVKARKEYSKLQNWSTFYNMIKTMKIRPLVSLFELFLPFISDRAFKFIVSLIRKEIAVFGIR